MANKKQPRISVKPPKLATLIVGPDKDKFVIHQDLLTTHSSYFRAALTGGFKEASTKTITLQDENPDIVRFFIHWLYHHRFPTSDDSPKLRALYAAPSSGDDDEHDDNGQLTTRNLIATYIFADKFLLPTLQRDVITELYIHVETQGNVALPDPTMVHHAFTHLHDDAPLCEYIVDAYCFFAQAGMWEDFVDVEWHMPFVGRVLSKYTESRRDDTPGPCHYHRHECAREEAECWRDLYGE